MIFGFVSEGFSCSGMNISVHSEILPSAGFGITTAIKAASALALRELYGFSCTDERLVSIIEKGNRQFLNTEHFSSDINAALFSRENACILTDHATGLYSIEPFDFNDISIILTAQECPEYQYGMRKSLEQRKIFIKSGRAENSEKRTICYEDSESEISDVLSTVSEDVRRRLVCIMKEHQFALDAVEGCVPVIFLNLHVQLIISEIMRDLYLISAGN